jgi:hypothetical protein
MFRTRVGESLAVRAETLLRLGLRNVADVALYRASLRLPFSAIRRLSPVSSCSGDHYREFIAADSPAAPERWHRQGWLFGWLPVEWEPGHSPDWLRNRLTGHRYPVVPWWQLSDHDAALGDIKGVWELSRFDWVPALAQQGVAGREEAWAQLNRWLDDWERTNPPFSGPNWMCGQEASIRILHLALAARISRQVESASPRLLSLVTNHLRRIAPTYRYARAQANNHGTSEAAALFVGGSWLMRAGCPEGQLWCDMGRAALEERVAHLVDRDGTFSQYSVNYHRLFLDTVAVAEIWRRDSVLPDWSRTFVERMDAATQWLWRMVDERTGDAPNIGANDGAQIASLCDADYRDHRPSVSRAAALFSGRQCFSDHPASAASLAWLGLPGALPDRWEPSSAVCAGGGFAVLRNSHGFAVVRFPRYRFRPSQEDALHVDFWWHGQNLLRDCGTFSYAATPEELRQFAGPAGHNVVQVDGLPQMPRLGRFLLGKWWPDASVSNVTNADGVQRLTVSAADRDGHRFHRCIELSDTGLCVLDEVHGVTGEAVWRWQLPTGQWTVTEQSANLNGIQLSWHVDGDALVTLTDSEESRYYTKRAPSRVLSVHALGRGTFRSRLVCTP